MRIPSKAIPFLALMLALGACSDSGSGDADPDAEVDCDPTRTIDVGPDQELPFEFEDTDRRYFVALPDDYDGSRAAPLVFSFHGSGGWAEQHEVNTQLARVGTERGYLVVTPDSVGEDPKEWNMFGSPDLAPDFEFADALFTDLESRLCIDTDRVFAAGFSNGSAFGGFLVCTEPYRFAAVAMVGGMAPSMCDAEVAAPPVLSMMGTGDPVNEIFPALDMFEQYRETYRCDDPVVDEPTETYERHLLEGCVHDTTVELLMLADAFHVWPGGPATQGTDKPGETFPATRAIYDFFDTQPA